jgi:hypothetical protein
LKGGVSVNGNMGRILPIIASVGVGIAAYQMMSRNGGNMSKMLPIASNMMGMTGTSGLTDQNQQQQNQ